MANIRSSRIIPVILVIIIAIIAVTALVSLARAIFFANSAPSNSAEVVDVSREALLNTAPGRQVDMTVRGPIVADEAFTSYRISVSPTSRSLTTYNGYLDRVVEQVNLPNNTAAYEEFVFALDKANLARGEQFPEEDDDTRGICATGRVYEFRIINQDDVVKRLWTSTCRGSVGSLEASVDQLTNLFVSQIPDASGVIRGVRL